MRILNEHQTLEEIQQRSISRFGDGELKLCYGKNCVSQIADKKLAAEMRQILISKDKCLIGIPNINASMPTYNFWQRYNTARYHMLYNPKKIYGSSFITRSDNAPCIKTEKYLNRMIDLWRNKDVTLVIGSKRSFMPHMFYDAKSVRVIASPRRDSYAKIDELMEAVGTPSGVVILSCGAAATCMAARLDKKGVHALDLGHGGGRLRERFKDYASIRPHNMIGDMPALQPHPRDTPDDLQFEKCI